MTIITHRNNVKPMFFLVSLMMVIFFCGVTTRALQRAGFKQLFGSNQLFYFFSSLYPIWMLVPIFFTCSSVNIIAFFCLVISSDFFSMVFFAPISFAIQFFVNRTTRFAYIPMFVFKPIKIRNGFNMIAVRTCFCYNRLRHNRFLNKRFCLEPVARYPLAVGLSYYRG